jgi:hypothetical protein
VNIPRPYRLHRMTRKSNQVRICVIDCTSGSARSFCSTLTSSSSTVRISVTVAFQHPYWRCRLHCRLPYWQGVSETREHGGMQNHIIVIEPLPFSSLAWSPFVPSSSSDRVDIGRLSYALPEKLSMSVPFGVCHLLFNHRPKTAAGCLRFHSCASLYGGVSTSM